MVANITEAADDCDEDFRANRGTVTLDMTMLGVAL